MTFFISSLSKITVIYVKPTVLRINKKIVITTNLLILFWFSQPFFVTIQYVEVRIELLLKNTLTKSSTHLVL